MTLTIIFTVIDIGTYDLENQGEGHYLLMTLENYCMTHK